MQAKSITKAVVFSAARYAHDLLRPGRDGNCLLVLQGMVPLGGCVQATPMLQALHAAFPDLPLAVATRGVGTQVLQNNPNVAHLLDFADPAKGLRNAGSSLRRQLTERSLRPRWSLLDLGSPRSRIALVHTLFLPGRLAGFSLAGALQHKALHRDPTRSYLANGLRLAEAIGAPALPSEPCVYASDTAIAQAQTMLAAVNPSSRPVAIFATQGSGGQRTQWIPDRMQALLRLTAQAGILPVLVGTADQASAIERLRAGVSAHTASLAGNTTIPQLAALLATADYAVSIDTGTMHVARASSVPMVVLAPTYQDPVEWLPLGIDHITVLRGPGIRPAVPGYMLDEIDLPQAAGAFQTLMERFPASPQARQQRLDRIRSNVEHGTASG